MLIGVSGVGAATAQIMLSAMNPSELIANIANANAGALQAIKGIGGKTAQRIIIELRDKVTKSNLSDNIFEQSGSNNVRNEALSALVLLGFSKQNAEKVVDKIIKQSKGDLSIENLIKESLKIL
jgi:Holliday junction DNA helicase RuvA